MSELNKMLTLPTKPLRRNQSRSACRIHPYHHIAAPEVHIPGRSSPDGTALCVAYRWRDCVPLIHSRPKRRMARAGSKHLGPLPQNAKCLCSASQPVHVGQESVHDYEPLRVVQRPQAGRTHCRTKSFIIISFPICPDVSPRSNKVTQSNEASVAILRTPGTVPRVMRPVPSACGVSDSTSRSPLSPQSHKLFHPLCLPGSGQAQINPPKSLDFSAHTHPGNGVQQLANGLLPDPCR